MHFSLKTANFWQFFVIFLRTVLRRGLRFFALRSVSLNALFEVSKTIFGNIYQFFTIRGSLTAKMSPNIEKKDKKNSEKKSEILDPMEQENRW